MDFILFKRLPSGELLLLSDEPDDEIELVFTVILPEETEKMAA